MATHLIDDGHSHISHSFPLINDQPASELSLASLSTIFLHPQSDAWNCADSRIPASEAKRLPGKGTQRLGYWVQKTRHFLILSRIDSGYTQELLF